MVYPSTRLSQRHIDSPIPEDSSLTRKTRRLRTSLQLSHRLLPVPGPQLPQAPSPRQRRPKGRDRQHPRLDRKVPDPGRVRQDQRGQRRRDAVIYQQWAWALRGKKKRTRDTNEQESHEVEGTRYPYRGRLKACRRTHYEEEQIHRLDN